MQINPVEIVNTIHDTLHLAHLTPKKMHKDGGEWEGPCAHCRKLTGNGGENRFRLNPGRPIEGHGSRKSPIFACRQCKQRFAPDKDWCGDLVQYVQDTLNLSFTQARIYLGLEPAPTPAPAHNLEPALTVYGAPDPRWQAATFQLMAECADRLWHPSFARVQEALTAGGKGRGIPEEVLIEAGIGWQDDPERYEDGERFGFPGERIRIPRGVTIPEVHIGEGGVKEMWSLAVRLTRAELEAEEDRTGKRPAKYRLLRGSIKNLYGAESIKPGLPVVLVEGQFDALSVRAAGRGEFGFAAVQGAASGKADPRILGYWLTRASGVLIAMDPDAAGEQAYKFWSGAIERSTDIRPVRGDLNDILREKGADRLYAFLCRGAKKFNRMFEAISLPQSTPQQPQEDRGDVETTGSVQPLVEEKTEPITVFSEPTSEKCSQCIRSVVCYDMDGTPYCQRHRRDKTAQMCDYAGCDGETAYTDCWGNGWCRSHFASYQLIQEGKAAQYPAVSLMAGAGIVGFSKDSEKRGIWGELWQDTEGFTLRKSYQRYLEFAQEADPACIWRAAAAAHEVRITGKAKSVPLAVQKPCARQECTRDASIAQRLHYETKKNSQEYRYPPQRSYTVLTGSGQNLTFCGHCTDAAYLLEMAEMTGYQPYKGATTKLPQGESAWVDFVCQSPHFDVITLFDEYRRSNPALWEKTMDFIHPA